MGPCLMNHMIHKSPEPFQTLNSKVVFCLLDTNFEQAASTGTTNTGTPD